MNTRKIEIFSLLFLLIWFGAAFGKGPGVPMQEVEGTVREIRVEKASPKARFGFVTALVATEKKEIKVRLYPEWWKLKPPFTTGDRIRVRGWIPPRTAFAGQPVLVAAEVKNLDTGAVLVLREGPGKPCWRTSLKPLVYSGEIVARKSSPGIGRPQIKWLVIEVKNSEGRVATFRISPLWLNDYPELKPGEKVEILAYQPPFWAARNIDEYMACRIVLLKDGRTLSLRKCPQENK
ncbi:hypothetical protein [Thermosulfurimonas dismutans]|uniref:Magnetosome protein MamS/MamX domain-containing protein n=1 Tax=Thermosulfurimonas dismutans TaxID=999894 RepID=A0A179D3R9_9BACT|nr:hypothetical protein [Thermosulfurimonas dismutans]OAQ20359.1 hypothetical protein TDIS_1554 [Thermosulfurimonas dismutans]